MIAIIKGELVEIEADSVILMTGGIGYQIYAPVSARQGQLAIGQEIMLYTHLYLREDVCMLFGFFSKKELALFQLLLAVNGIGAKTALAMLNTLSYAELIQGIQFGNALLLTKIPGIGKKTAERILLELKDKIIKLKPEPTAVSQSASANTAGGWQQPLDSIQSTAIAALTQLGYSGTQATKFVTAALALPESPQTLEATITAALKIAANN